MTYRYWKRRLDICAAVLLLTATSPLWIATGLLLLAVQGRPVLFRQLRVGQQGRLFVLLKFRTMTAGAPPRLPDRPVGRIPDDPRITPMGRFLRRFAIDELPQLLNVLRGDMSLVGPRPLPQEDLDEQDWLATVMAEERQRRQHWAARRQAVPPGLTGRWQISRQPEEDFANWMACDLAYLDHLTFREDLRILLATPLAVLRGRRRIARP